jgi:hypothetical protein
MEQLNLKNNQLHWIPVDLPNVDFKQELIKDFIPNFVGNTSGEFQSQRLTLETKNYKTTTWLSDLTESQKKLKEYIEKFLPFDEIINIRINNPIKIGGMHYDLVDKNCNKDLLDHHLRLEPTGYRLILTGGKQGDLVVKINNLPVQVTVPDTTDWYLIGHAITPHRLKKFDENRLIVFCHGWINEKKHKEIMDRSIEKYSQYAIYD